MRYYCTLFDKNYLLRGLALYLSLVRFAKPFKLWALCMDDKSFEVLSKIRLDGLAPIKLSEFEDSELLKIKQSRTPGEYCWTCTPSLPLYVLQNYPEVDVISYLDADLCFYNTPELIFQEMGTKSIMIIPHRFSNRRKLKEKNNGIYNVGMLSFRRDKEGLKCLKWWRNKCLDWCYYRYEENKIGDQKYLDEFPKLFRGVCILENIGAGVGVWNIQQYSVRKIGKDIFINKAPLIFYHFADFIIYAPIPFILPAPLTGYGEVSVNRKLIYNQYFQLVYRAAKIIQRAYPDFKYGFTPRPQWGYVKEAILEKVVLLFWKTKNILAI